MKNKVLLTLAIACSPVVALAHNISVGQMVPDVTVKSYGEVILKGEDTAFQTWTSKSMQGKVRIIQAIAGRSSAKELNAPLIAAVKAAKFPKQSYQTTSIINQDDALWGTGGFVKSSAQDSKKEFPWSSIVLDEEGDVASAWQLAAESSAIIVQDKRGKVLFVKQGALNQDEIKQVISLVKQHL